MHEISFAACYSDQASMILRECLQALNAISAKETEALVQQVLEAEKIFFVGVGRVLLSLKAIAKRWAHLGLSTHIVGDITEPSISNRDILIVGSGSGESLVPVVIAKKAVELGAKVVYIGSNAESTIANLSALMVRIPVRTKLNKPDEIASLQPMTSLFEQSLLLYGDAIAAMIIQTKQIDMNSLWYTHANLE